MNSFYFLDLFLFVFVLQFVLYFKEGLFYLLWKWNFWGYWVEFMTSKLVFRWVFLCLCLCFFFIVTCFGGYFVYSYCFLGLLEVTFFVALTSWLSTLMTFVSSEKFSIYMNKSGDKFLKTFSMLMVEVVSELSRPLALTVRLTVNIMVGHLISSMLFVFLSGFGGVFLVWVSVFAIMLECFVFFIQSYIFSRLIYLYLNE
uniref:F-ATPase protein 6 n=1 Tax=Cucullanus robustus TaxID=657293 RepID=G4V246_9BILA|nr:ATP synthase F0 subunit 6 [Cucullanus robustus]ACV96763.1 ATP synthase F0 subunit 6 [Cucullanus robustus]